MVVRIRWKWNPSCSFLPDIAVWNFEVKKLKISVFTRISKTVIWCIHLNKSKKGCFFAFGELRIPLTYKIHLLFLVTNTFNPFWDDIYLNKALEKVKKGLLFRYEFVMTIMDDMCLNIQLKVKSLLKWRQIPPIYFLKK